VKNHIKLFYLICIFCFPNVNAQNYLINFNGSGESTIVDTVKVENLATREIKTISGNDVLRLTTATGIYYFDYNQSSDLKIFPNPMTENSTLQIYPFEEGNAVITIVDITGKLVAQIMSYLENSRQDFGISGVEKGFYMINVKGNNYQFTGKLISNNKSDGTIKIEKLNNIIQSIDKKSEKTDSKSPQATVDMAYSAGNRLKFTGKSGICSTIIMDIPLSGKTITFNFVVCTDGDYNSYSIGTQVWMAENLKTTKYNEGTAVPLITDRAAWAALSTPGYCWYNNDASYIDTYGALYNWFTVKTGKLCPAGWHVPSDPEWTTLTQYLTNNGYGYGGIGSDIAKSIAATSGWAAYSVAGTVGNDQLSNNSSGFSARRIGWRENYGTNGVDEYRCYWWSATEGISIMGLAPSIYNNSPNVFRQSYYKQYGFSVRCLMNN
jgi:uncharacterized protein (TIGR02145 family)